MPSFFYGTAWKEGDTQRLTELALAAGFRAIDTANQRRHYHEAGVGDAIRAAIGRGDLARSDLFLQTKFTYLRSQDHRLPYDRHAKVADQVRQSFASSLSHLGVEKLDSYVLHGPSASSGFAALDWEVWGVMEELQVAGQVSLLGVSNVTAKQLEELCAGATSKPAFVQNRCYASQGWDLRVREVCRKHDVVYQGFSLLTANRASLRHPELLAIAARHGKTPAQVIFCFALAAGMIPLTGTSDPAHMREDLGAFSFALSEAEVESLERIEIG